MLTSRNLTSHVDHLHKRNKPYIPKKNLNIKKQKSQDFKAYCLKKKREDISLPESFLYASLPPTALKGNRGVKKTEESVTYYPERDFKRKRKSGRTSRHKRTFLRRQTNDTFHDHALERRSFPSVFRGPYYVAEREAGKRE